MNKFRMTLASAKRVMDTLSNNSAAYAMESPSTRERLMLALKDEGFVRTDGYIIYDLLAAYAEKGGHDCAVIALYVALDLIKELELDREEDRRALRGIGDAIQHINDIFGETE